MSCLLGSAATRVMIPIAILPSAIISNNYVQYSASAARYASMKKHVGFVQRRTSSNEYTFRVIFISRCIREFRHMAEVPVPRAGFDDPAVPTGLAESGIKARPGRSRRSKHIFFDFS
jgi:hypothetical protein